MEAESIYNKIDYKFICCICLWYEILSKVNIASKELQSIKSNVQGAVTSLASVKQFLDDFSETGYEKVIEDANQMCEQLEIEPEFIVNRKRKADQRPDVPEEEFQCIFSCIIEKAISSIGERFETLKKYQDLFSFLYDFDHYDENVRNGNLMKACKNLEEALSYNGISDIDGEDLFHELSIVHTLVKDQRIDHALDILNTIMKRDMKNVVPNAVIALRIMLTCPISVASGERSFSKLKIIKNYLRNSMNQDRLNSLSIISIEHEFTGEHNFRPRQTAICGK